MRHRLLRHPRRHPRWRVRPDQTDVNTIDGVTLARTVSFYDNEYGFTSNMIRTLLYFAEISE